MKNLLLLILTGLIFQSATAQDNRSLISLFVPANLKENANAAVRDYDIVVTIESQDKVVIEEKRVVSVFNESGMNSVDAFQHYSESLDILNLKATIYDALGNEIDEFKERDFKDGSAVSNGTLYSDARVKYLEYTPRKYPLTIVFESRVKSSNTAFIPSWTPISNRYESVESSTYKIINETDIKLKERQLNFESYDVETLGDFQYKLTNAPALPREVYQPSLMNVVPRVKVALSQFEMIGVKGVNNDWKDFGKWMYDELINGRQELPQEVIDEVNSITQNATSDLEKAKIIYDYMQKRSRYISVQVGIGGWMPIEAQEVHKMSYGDCKGLTNYTMALLDQVGVQSNYAAIYGGREKRSMDPDFSMLEGNHVILYLPNLDNDKDYWLECTSTTAPFGYLGDFTDDRHALIVKADGGELKKTTSYATQDNQQHVTGAVKVHSDGTAQAKVKISSIGVQYDWRSGVLRENLSAQKDRYLDNWNHLNGLSINQINHIEDKDAIRLDEQLEVEIDKFGTKMGNLILFYPVMFNRFSDELPEDSSRIQPISIERGYVDEDSYALELDEDLVVDGLPNNVEVQSDFGSYELDFVNEENRIQVTRKLTINEGTFPADRYEEYREFRNAVVAGDNARAALKKIKK
ncbi:DUF3857 domain-containing protein [Nonlabens ponticola]|uniref:DUF3857 domain-containing protein n=1 Tax=Nonlabens ponticola TaxID=2496866 RepID=A0A3S9MWK7_9FLAO|nr:DUF3857 domain-containing protein [Nonlabens ponticola]AZQ43570.1 DUF3857 domain-containing protein [Nonlabens ponticola]